MREWKLNEWMKNEVSCYKQMVTDQRGGSQLLAVRCLSTSSRRPKPFFPRRTFPSFSHYPPAPVQTFSAMPMYFSVDPAFSPDTMLIIPSWGCFHLLVQFDWKALAALPAVPSGLPIYPVLPISLVLSCDAGFHLYPRHSPVCCFQQGAVSKIQQDFTPPSRKLLWLLHVH